jgi:hypothetical protein
MRRRLEDLDVQMHADVVGERGAPDPTEQRPRGLGRERGLELGGHVVDERLAVLVGHDQRRVREAEEVIGRQREEDAVRAGRLGQHDLAGTERQTLRGVWRGIVVHGVDRVLEHAPGAARAAGEQREEQRASRGAR